MRQEAAATGRLPVFDAPAGGRLSRELLGAYRRNGVVLLRDFVDPGACRGLRQRALELVESFDPTAVQSVFAMRTTLHVIDQRCHYPASNWLQRGPELPLRGFAD